MAVETLPVELDLRLHICIIIVTDMRANHGQLFNPNQTETFLIHFILKVFRNLHLNILSDQFLRLPYLTLTREKLILYLLVYLRHHFDPQRNTLILALQVLVLMTPRLEITFYRFLKRPDNRAKLGQSVGSKRFCFSHD